MEGGEGSSRRKHMHWTDAMNRLFFDTIREKGADPSKPDLGFKNTEWQQIGDIMRQKLNVDIPVLKLKNHMKIWKANAKSLNEIRKQSGFSWNERKRQFEANVDVWEAFLQGNPNAKYWKDKSVSMFFEEVAKFLEPDYGTGEETMTYGDLSLDDEAREDHHVDTDGLDDMEATMVSIGLQTPPPPSQPTQPEGNSLRRARVSGGRAESSRSAKRSRGSTDNISSPLKRIADAVVDLVACVRQMSRRSTCDEISKAVRNIPDLDPRHRRIVIRKLTKDINEGMAFLSCPTLEEKKQWVEELVEERVGSAD